MTLTRYKQKRNFKQTPEPTGGKAESDQLHFVIQKHDASHLHYDFRLEMDGVLKSWAVPKGPSLNPEVKRLAMMVEDHPYDYKDFEGIIPNGYGAGTVIVWDEGTYESSLLKSDDKKKQDKDLRQQLKKGNLKITLHGNKLKGEFALVKTKGLGENSWLLIKHKDKYASETDVLKKNKSVISKKTIEQVEKTSKQFYNANREKKSQTSPEMSKQKNKDLKATSKKSLSEKKNKTPPKKIIKTKLPTTLKPMLATLIDKPFDRKGWVYEIKWDGYRALSFMNKGKADLKSRNNKSFNEKFYPIYQSIKKWGINAIVDGEIVVIDEKGISHFGNLQNWRNETDGYLVYYIFDILWMDGKDLTSLSLLKRRDILSQVMPDDDRIRLSKIFMESGTDFYNAAKQNGLEGIIAKKADSKYYPGTRTDNWLKIKANKRQEMVIGGYTVNDDTSKPFSALLVGFYDKKKFIYAGKIGTGFSVKTQNEMLKLFKPLETSNNYFDVVPDVNKPHRFRTNPPHAEVIWLKPQLVCEVSFAEMTSDGVMRHPSFEGMRMDKKAKDVILEKETVIKEVPKIKGREKKSILSKHLDLVKNKDRKTFLNATDETQEIKINGHALTFTHLNKLYWPKEKITKGDLLNYYHQVASYMLPYLKDRPQSLNRHPGGITGAGFYQKDVTGKVPDWIHTFLYHSEDDKRDKHFLVARDEASLLYMASLGCIEINPWSSRIQKPDYPDWCIIDLDPDKNSFDQVIETALVTRDILEELGVKGYCKTSGSTGLHIYIPLGAKYTYEQSKEFARIIVTLVHEELPKFTSLERSLKARKGKIYLDFLQNRTQATVAAPYSVRPKAMATVSAPLHWEEVKKGLKMQDFTIYTMIDRLKNEGDIFKPVLGKGINLQTVIKKFNLST
ncbi:MAG TPA: DNA ligase D [Bacteroidia bacterium]|nr:DNA ligase D [Bacteroidia bacterium]